jgi:hypothetical protein
MIKLKSIEEANEVSAVRLVSKRQSAKVGDIFRVSPYADIFLWGRLIKRAKFFGLDAEFSIVYLYDAIGKDRPSAGMLSPQNLIIGPSVVNSLGWSRGYWEIVASEPVKPADMLDHHNFIRYHGTGSTLDYDIVDEEGRKVQSPNVSVGKFAQSGIGNFNFIDWQLKAILHERGLIWRIKSRFRSSDCRLVPNPIPSYGSGGEDPSKVRVDHNTAGTAKRSELETRFGLLASFEDHAHSDRIGALTEFAVVNHGHPVPEPAATFDDCGYFYFLPSRLTARPAGISASRRRNGSTRPAGARV